MASSCSAWCPGGLTVAKAESNSPLATLLATYRDKYSGQTSQLKDAIT